MDVNELAEKLDDALSEETGDGQVEFYKLCYAYRDRILSALRSQDRLREALEIAATVFEEYGRLHRAKLSDNTPTHEYLTAVKKAERNERYAQEMREALKETQP